MKDLILFSILLIFLFKLYSRWHDAKMEENCDTMEKIWIKKELNN